MELTILGSWIHQTQFEVFEKLLRSQICQTDNQKITFYYEIMIGRSSDELLPF